MIDEADQMLRDTNDFQDKMMGLTESSGFPKVSMFFVVTFQVFREKASWLFILVMFR